MSAAYLGQAVAVLTGKAQRLRASAESRTHGAERKRQLADAMEWLAPAVAQGPLEVRRRLAESPGQGIDPDARRHAANEIYALALQRESQGAESNAAAPPRDGWERGADDLGLPVHTATLREAVALLELAEAVHPEPYWTWTRAGILDRLGSYLEAADLYGRAGESYAAHAPVCIARCLAKAAGTYDATAEHARFVEEMVARCKANGVDLDPILEVQAQLGDLLAQAAIRPAQSPDRNDTRRQPLSSQKLDRAAQAAQAFAELLADGNFEAAQQRLSKHLKRTTADALRRDYERMTMAGEFPQEGPVEIIVMMSQDNMPSLKPGDLGWVYVAITGSQFNEALTLIVTEEQGEARIRDIEWGRP